MWTGDIEWCSCCVLEIQQRSFSTGLFGIWKPHSFNWKWHNFAVDCWIAKFPSWKCLITPKFFSTVVFANAYGLKWNVICTDEFIRAQMNVGVLWNVFIGDLYSLYGYWWRQRIAFSMMRHQNRNAACF